jgi:FtsZ-binding cell division protein ZapB
LGLLTVLLAVTAAVAVLHAADVDSGSDSGGVTAETVDNTREALRQWVEVRRVISKEKQDARLSKEILNERISLVQHEIDALREKIDEAEKSIAEADTKRQQMIDENEKLKAVSDSLTIAVDALEARCKKLLARLPDPIRDRVKPLSQRFPENPAESKLAMSQRFQNVIGVLNEINKFNREITVTSEVRALPDGTSTEVTALYIGIGQGYYVNAKGDIAGVGAADGSGWTWTLANEAGPRIVSAIAILKNEQVATFVDLPITLHGTDNK